tara:strand:+ start:326 stop:559 length:234 start_codon:yes stop_codon:yes gene_type:complete
MNKILISITILLFSSVFAFAEKQKCTDLPLGKAYFSCLKEKVTGITTSSSDPTTESSSKDDRNWYQKIKDGKPLLSK